LLKGLVFLVWGTPDVHTRLRNGYVLNRIEQLDLPPRSSVLDMGCGRAVSLFWLARRHPDWHLTGVELDPAQAQSARQAVERGPWPNMSIVEGKLQDLGEDNSRMLTYDLIMAVDVMEHVEDDVGLLREIRRMLTPGGYLILHVPRRQQDQWRWLPIFERYEVHDHVRTGYTSEGLRQMALAAGFRAVDVRATVGRWGEISFELNNLLWPWPTLRYLLAILTYPITVPLAYLDVRHPPRTGNSLLLTATAGQSPGVDPG
jgi:SAM-dependent methyltransferase